MMSDRSSSSVPGFCSEAGGPFCGVEVSLFGGGIEPGSRLLRCLFLGSGWKGNMYSKNEEKGYCERDPERASGR